MLGFFKKEKNIFYKSRFYLQLKERKTIKYFFIFLFRIIEKEKYYHINFYNYLISYNFEFQKNLIAIK